MLEVLSIQNVLLIDRLELSFTPGLSVLTGETGAGKSILLESLGLVLGERGGATFIRPGASCATITASFHPIPKDLLPLLEEQGVGLEDGSLVLRRVLSPDGRSRAYVNDQLVSVSFVKTLASALLEIHGQFDNLLHPSHHRGFLDRDQEVQTCLETLKATHQTWSKALHTFTTAKSALQTAREQEAFLRFCLEEINAASPLPQEDETLQDERTQLLQSAKLEDALSQSYQLLNQDGGTLQSLREAHRSLAKAPLSSTSPLGLVAKTLESTLLELEDTAQTLKTLLREQHNAPARLEEVENRLALLRGLARKHAVPLPHLHDFWQNLQAQVNSLTQGTQNLQDLEKISDEARKVYETQASALSQKRQEVAHRLQQAVLTELAPLKLEKARFEIALTRKNEADWDDKGWDSVEFLIQTNPGLPLGSFAKIASGGERSRFLLALKVAFAQTSPVGLMVFDEIDAGVGGAVAHAIGERLSRLSKKTQVLTVTHAPQVAAFANNHFVVSKQSQDHETTTDVNLLTHEERREEIARMLSGDAVEDAARAAADALLAQAS